MLITCPKKKKKITADYKQLATIVSHVNAIIAYNQSTKTRLSTLTSITGNSSQLLSTGHFKTQCLDAERVERVSESQFFSLRGLAVTDHWAGRGGAKRHRKILRDNIQGITKPVRVRLSR